MSELRHDPLDDRWIVVAPDRARRPRFVRDTTLRPPLDADCPFCPGREARTRPAVAVVEPWEGAFRYRAVDEEVPGWWVRVVPNLYPMLEVEAEARLEGGELGRRRSGLGAHEVVVETPRHDADLGDLSEQELAAVLVAWRERLRDLYLDHRLAQVQVFRNQGGLAGASVAHAHSQITAMGFEPTRAWRQRRRAREHHEKTGEPLLDAMWRGAQEQERVLWDEDGVGVFAPWASLHRYELLVLMPQASSRFVDLDDAQAHALARAVGDGLRRVREVLGDPPVHLGLFVEPNESHAEVEEALTGFRWHLRIVPRLQPLAGFEWMGDIHVNSTPPEDAVRHLQSAD